MKFGLKMDFKINFHGKIINLRDVGLCNNIFSQAKGLMFSKKNKILLFIFKIKSKRAIHSFFVRKPFLAIWMNNGVVVDIKIIKPWKISVKPKEKFDILLEIPVDNKQIFDFPVDLRNI